MFLRNHRAFLGGTVEFVESFEIALCKAGFDKDMIRVIIENPDLAKGLAEDVERYMEARTLPPIWQPQINKPRKRGDL